MQVQQKAFAPGPIQWGQRWGWKAPLCRWPCRADACTLPCEVCVCACTCACICACTCVCAIHAQRHLFVSTTWFVWDMQAPKTCLQALSCITMCLFSYVGLSHEAMQHQTVSITHTYMLAQTHYTHYTPTFTPPTPPLLGWGTPPFPPLLGWGLISI
jgi:hypothetical protein